MVESKVNNNISRKIKCRENTREEHTFIEENN